MTDLRALLGDQYDETIEKARLAIEDELIELRDLGVSVLNRNGLTVNARDGSHSGIRRMSTAMGVHTALGAVLPDLLAQAWDQGRWAEQRWHAPCLLHDISGEDVPGWEMAECTCEDLVNPHRARQETAT